MNIERVPNKLYNKAWKWAAKTFGTTCNGHMLNAEAARALDCWLAGYYSGKRAALTRDGKKG